ncbi:hypothetical protein HYALB_00010107 [Hymenoscyphus albidus]|uniref:Calcofluor white hypersensitive protein n=1 Tax=Hymenoscyphus albidus TaxID=595503 RepID=A0A9N9Q095_9HELO|nr:hypothetical protein HYALB_00010107 [Hymenoscyphus albidus]
MAQPKSRVPLMVTLAAAGGVGYYLYTAGGSPKVAEKQFESDISKASAKLKSEMPGRTNQAQKETEKWGSEAGAKVDSLVEKAKAEAARAESATMKKIDEVDRKVEAQAAKAKSSWFSGK